MSGHKRGSSSGLTRLPAVQLEKVGVDPFARGAVKETGGAALRTFIEGHRPLSWTADTKRFDGARESLQNQAVIQAAEEVASPGVIALGPREEARADVDWNPS